jgi:streptogramin lyase
MRRIVTVSLFTIAVVAATVGMLASPASAAPIGFTQQTLNGQDFIYQIDMTAPGLTLVGPTGIPPATRGLTMNADGVLYGANGGNLYTFNTSTGAATLVGALGCCSNVTEMTFDADGNLWLIANSPSNLYSVNASTGAATLVGGLGGRFMSGLAGDCDGNVFGIDHEADQLVLVDTAAPASSSNVGPLGLAIGSGALAFDTDEVLWMLSVPVAGNPSTTSEINTSTGAATISVANVGGNAPIALALQPPDCPDDPTTTTTTAGNTSTTTSGAAATAPRSAAAAAVATTPSFTG